MSTPLKGRPRLNISLASIIEAVRAHGNQSWAAADLGCNGGPRMVPCEICGKEVQDRRALAGHRRFVHPETVTFKSSQDHERRIGLGDPPGRAEGRPPESRFNTVPWHESTDKMDELARNAARAAKWKIDGNPRVLDYLAKIGFNVEKALRAAIQLVADEINAGAGDQSTMEALIEDLERRFEIAYEKATAEQIEQLTLSQETPASVTEAQCQAIVRSEFKRLGEILIADAQKRDNERHPPGFCEESRCSANCRTRILRAKTEVLALVEHRLPNTVAELKMIETAMRSGDIAKLPITALHLIDEVADKAKETSRDRPPNMDLNRGRTSPDGPPSTEWIVANMYPNPSSREG